MRVPAANLVGTEDRGWYTLAVALDFERSGVGYSATARRTIETLTEYAKQTERDGKPLSEDPHIRRSLARRFVEAEVSARDVVQGGVDAIARHGGRTQKRPCPKCTARS